MSHLIGTTLAHYEVVALLGKGGMGEVYRAHDTRLGRDVAVKILPKELVDAEGLARFEREARVLASLNHPNVAAIFGIERGSGVTFLVMEFVEGDDLARRLRAGPLPIPEALAVARQIAVGLEEAHSRGIVHRDLKPANVKVSPRGQVKILDFGLAKAVGGEPAGAAMLEHAPTVADDMTRPGIVLGTVAYMSPEQARGQACDARTDVWSFGLVLWECLTGERLFGGDSAADSIAAILHRDPDWSRLPAATPAPLRRVLRRCLTRDPGRRFHHMADVRLELDDAMEPDPTSGPSPSPRRLPVASVVLAMALVLAVVLLVRDRLQGPPLQSAPENPLDGARFTRLTDFPGDEFDGAISPDGRFVAFVSDRDGPFDIFLGQVNAPAFRNLTHELTELSMRDVRGPVRSVGFDHDGSQVWLGGGTGHRMQLLSILGGPVRNFLGNDAVNVSWSPDGEHLVYHLSAPGDPIYVADRDGANERLVLDSEAGVHQHYPIWSVDGRWIFFSRGRPGTAEMDLWRVRPDGSGLEQLTRDKRSVRCPAPLDAHTVLFCAQEFDGAGPWLWSLDLDSGVSRRVSIGLEQYESVAVSADGQRIVATVENPQAALWRVPILVERLATEGDVRAYPVPTVRALTPRFGGSRLFYLSSRGAGDGLWSFHDGRSEEIWKGREIPLLEPPAVSRDGSSIALVLRKDGGQRLHVLSADGAELHALTAELDARGSATWSPDGRWLAAGGSVNGVEGLYKIPVAGGPPQRIAQGEALNPAWSPDGSLIVYAGQQVQALAPLKAVTPDGDHVDLPDIQLLREGGVQCLRFLPDGSGLVYLKGLTLSQDFWLLDLATMQSRRLTQLDRTATMRTFDVSPDGSEIVFDRLQQGSDLVLIELATSDAAK